MPTINELHELHLRQLDLTLAESELLLLREGGLDGELKTSGSICEQFVRDILRRVLVPGHFRITSGFIATPALLRDRKNLPQCDILIVEGNSRPILRFESVSIAFEAPRARRRAAAGVSRPRTPSLCQKLAHGHAALR